MNGKGQGFACSISMFLFLYPGAGFTSPCPKKTRNLPSVRESRICPLRSDSCLLLCQSDPGDAAVRPLVPPASPSEILFPLVLPFSCVTHVP